MNLPEVRLPGSHNYIACFLTFKCNLGCEYCINRFNNKSGPGGSDIPGDKWAAALNRLYSRDDLPVTIQGGEPGLHPDFIPLINDIRPDLNIDILTNLTFNVDDFIKRVDPLRFRRKAPYPGIRISYHPSHMDSVSVMEKTLKMQEAGFSVGVYGILHPAFSDDILRAKDSFRARGIDFRTKEFLGEYQGRLYGEYLYPEAVGGKELKKCLCRSSELIIGPDASVYKCHSDLYKGLDSIGSLLDPGFVIEDVFRECARFGDCNPCDIKIKTNRFQVHGHTSVEIKNIGGLK